MMTMVRSWAKRVPTIVKWRNRILRQKDAILHSHDFRTVSEFPVFAPNSGGPVKARSKLTAKSAGQTLPLLVQFIESTTGQTFKEPIPINTLGSNENRHYHANSVKLIFDRHGSDKAIESQDYHYLYAMILEDLRPISGVLEIGIGTNNPGVVSTMGVQGKPGASLRAFRELLPHATIFGADVDRDILFQEPGIKTFFVDQTNMESINLLATQIDSKLDLIIDDGLHSPDANIATLIFACENLKKGGWFVVEDIAPAALPLWRVISTMLPIDFRAWIISSQTELVFVMHRSGVVQSPLGIRLATL